MYAPQNGRRVFLKNKIVTAAEAVAAIKDGDTIMVSGFLGTGSPEILLDALVEKGVKHLTLIANDGGLRAEFTGTTDKGVAKLITAGMVDHIIASHIGMNPDIGNGALAGTMKYTLYPQGTLAEKIRAAGAGLGGVLTPTGVGTIVAEGKETLTIEGKEYLLELPLHADFALCRADYCDAFGNFAMLKATKNFNHVMAMAADTVILASEQVFEIGEKDPDFYQVAGVYVDYIVKGEKPWQI
jgi:acetate CoA/acetoacetate CoA-transferase alpha subunit